MYKKRKSIITLSLFLSLVSFQLFAETVWIDVRSTAENFIDHIEGDVNIPHSEIVEKVTALYPDKETNISLYCKSGGRAGKAMQALKAAGYQQVQNAGGINDARKQRGLLAN